MVFLMKDYFVREMKFTNVSQKCDKYNLQVKSSVSATDALPVKRQ